MPADGGAAGSGGRARGLMILTEGGQLVVHDLQRWQPTPLTLPIQEMPPITVARLVPTVSAALLRDGTIVAGGAPAVHSPVIPGSAQPSPSPRGGEPLGSASSVAAAQQGPQHGLTLERVRACSRRAGADVPPSADHWPFTGGVPAASLTGMGAKRHPSALYFSGHRDGRVRVWDATTQVPEQLLTIPASAGQERLRAVTALEVRGRGVRGAQPAWRGGAMGLPPARVAALASPSRRPWSTLLAQLHTRCRSALSRGL